LALTLVLVSILGIGEAFSQTQVSDQKKGDRNWFPLRDRNPQTFTPNIFWAKPEDFRKATQRIYHAPGQASFIEMPLVTTP
jgi:hypothetical protein